MMFNILGCGKMIDFGEFDKMIKISGKVGKLNIYNEFSGNILFFIHKIRLSSSVNKEWNITTKPVESFWFIHFSIYDV